MANPFFGAKSRIVPERDVILAEVSFRNAIRRTLVIAEQAGGIRALMAHPIDEDATQFYLRFGFVVSLLREQQLLLLLKDALRLFLTFNK